MLAGRLLHAVGPATDMALDPSRVRVIGTSKCPSVADRRRDLPLISLAGVARSHMYVGAVPLLTACIIMHSL